MINTFCWQRKSWASSVTAKSAQAVFLCLVHNLMVCYEATLAKAGIQNIAEEKRREKILTERTAKVEKTGRQMPLIISGFQRLCWNTGKNNSPAISAALRFPAHRQIHQMAAMFSLAAPPLDVLLLILKKRYATL